MTTPRVIKKKSKFSTRPLILILFISSGISKNGESIKTPLLSKETISSLRNKKLCYSCKNSTKLNTKRISRISSTSSVSSQSNKKLAAQRLKSFLSTFYKETNHKL
jgi:hypothetical protein